MTVSKPLQLRATGSADLLELMPYLLGFHPSESVVLVVISQGRLGLAARVDIPPIPAVEPLLRQLRHIAERNDATALVLFAFTSDRENARALLSHLAAGLGDFDLLDAVHADGERWWSVGCTAGCCPSDGTPYAPGSGVLAAEAVYAGLAARSSREELAASVAGPAPEEDGPLRALLWQARHDLQDASRSRRRELMAERVRQFLAAPRTLEDRERAELAWLAVDIEVRDIAWALMSRDQADAHVALWSQVVEKTVSPWDSGPLCLLGMAAWISGNGALMVCCAERVTALDPGYTMAGLLEQINHQALPPRAWDLLAESMRAELGVHFPKPLAG